MNVLVLLQLVHSEKATVCFVISARLECVEREFPPFSTGVWDDPPTAVIKNLVNANAQRKITDFCCHERLKMPHYIT